MAPTVLHLRSETKPLERRSACKSINTCHFRFAYDWYPVTPTTTKELIEAGYIVNVERSPLRIFKDKEFEDVGASLVAEGSWVNVPKDHIIVGLKELASDDCKLIRILPFVLTDLLIDCAQLPFLTYTSTSDTAIKTKTIGIATCLALLVAVVCFTILNS